MFKVWNCGIIFLFLFSSVEAKMYKCTMPDGSVKYSGRSCYGERNVVERLDRKSYRAIENSANYNYEIHDLCSKKHSHDDYMRKTCVSVQASSLTYLIKIQDIYPGGSVPRRAVATCIDMSKDEERLVNYRKALRCTQSTIR